MVEQNTFPFSARMENFSWPPRFWAWLPRKVLFIVFSSKTFFEKQSNFFPWVHQKRDLLGICMLDFSRGECLSLLEAPPFREIGIFCSLLGLIVSGIKIILEYFSSKFDPFQGLFFKHQSGKISKVADYNRHFFRPRILLKMLFKRTKTLFFKKYFSFNFCRINFFSDFWWAFLNHHLSVRNR